MEDADIRCLEIEQDYSNIAKILGRFVQKYDETFTFEIFNKNGNRQKLANIIFKLLADKDAKQCHKECLAAFRIISRDKRGLNEMMDELRILTLLKLACLIKAEEGVDDKDALRKVEIVSEALKALCNLVYNSPVAATYVSRLHASEGIIARMKMYREKKIPLSIKHFDMKLLFLITALTPESRPKLKHELNGLVYLAETFDLILKESPPKSKNSRYVKLNDIHCDLCCEILKVIFNLMAKVGGIGNVPLADEVQEERLCVRFTSIAHDLLLAETSSPEKQDELRNHTINLLISVPPVCYSEITTPATSNTPKELIYEGRSMEAVEVILQFLVRKIHETQENSKNKEELLPPILTAMVQLSSNVRVVRKYLRQRILPPLKDVMTRPEVGDTLRAKICRLLTSPSSPIKDLAADFLFTLCKENVGRMIKYTGYGNAAGLLANRGLLFTGKPKIGSEPYSSDSDSDTEEYSKYANLINPVIGCYEVPQTNPFDEMTEEQKEYEAVKLANMLDKLSREGVIQPCQVGEDGRPQPVEHILKLQENLQSQQVKSAKQ